MNQGYIIGDNSGLRVTDEYIEKFKQLKIIPPGITDEDLNKELQNDLISVWTAYEKELSKIDLAIKTTLNKALQSKLNNDAEAFLNSETSIYKALPKKPLFNFILNVYNIYLRYWINEFSHETYKRQLRSAIKAFGINCHSENINFNSKIVKFHRHPEILHKQFCSERYDILCDKNLLDKLLQGENNPYLKFLNDSIDYLKEIRIADPPIMTKLNKKDNSLDIPLHSTPRFRHKVRHHSEARYATIPGERLPVIPRQSTPLC